MELHITPSGLSSTIAIRYYLDSNQATSYTLHEAMKIVLEELPDNQVHAAELSDEIYFRNLYRRKDGTQAQANQIRARSRNYPNLFEVLEGNVIKLR